jgi:nitrite reductase/ring-hydroxylating ferredoxin subunit
MTDLVAQFKSDELHERGLGLRFELPQLGTHATGFVVRYDGKAYAYINQCAHVPVELDWEHGKFFTIGQDYLICATHGAHYAPETGHCVMGPCKGKRLQALQVEEHNNQISIYLNKSTPYSRF